MTLVAHIKIATHTSDDMGMGLDDKWEHIVQVGAPATCIDPDSFAEEFGKVDSVEFADETNQTFPTTITLDREEKWTDASNGEQYWVTHGTVVTIQYEDVKTIPDAHAQKSNR